MKKFIFSVLALSAALVLASAQDKNTLTVTKTDKTVDVQKTGDAVSTTVKETTATEIEHENTMLVNEFSKNWEVSFGIGTQAYLGEYTGTHFKFGNWWTGPALDASIQKWASPYFALGLGLNFSPYKGLYGAGDSKAIFANDGNDHKYNDKNGGNSLYLAGDKLSRWYGNIFVQFSFDMTNLFGGYRSDRMYHLIGYLGGGVAVALNSTKYASVAPTFNAGLVNQFNLNQKWALNLTVRGALYGDNLNGISYFTSTDAKNCPLDGMIGLTFGASYRFGFVTKKSALTGEETTAAWIPMTTAILASKEYADAVNEAKAANGAAKQYEEAAAQNEERAARAERALQAANKTIEQQQKELSSKIPYSQIINFPIDKWTLSDREKVAIMLAAEAMKLTPDTKYSVVGYADMQTANPKHNLMLSIKRAEAVSKCLVEEFGIDPDQLVVDHKGGVDFMYYDNPQCSRSVLIKALP